MARLDCKVCGHEVSEQEIGGKHWVLCQSPVCRPDGLGIGRPLSDGKATASEAGAQYADSLADGEC